VPTPRRHTDMKKSARWLGAAALVAGLTTGCGGGTPPAPPSAAGSTPQQPDAAVSVRVVVSGGITGAHEVYEVQRDDATSADAERVLDLAGAPAVRDLGTRRHRPAVECCDIQVYEVTVRYADGTSAKIVTDSTSAPRPLQRLVSLVSAPR
jgi:hypothetical protein